MNYTLITNAESLERFPISEWAFDKKVKVGDLITFNIQGQILLPKESTKLCYEFFLNKHRQRTREI